MAVFGNPVQVLLALVLGSGSVRSRYAMLQGARRAINQSASRGGGGGGARGYVFISRCLAGWDRGRAGGPTYTGHDECTGRRRRLATGGRPALSIPRRRRQAVRFVITQQRATTRAAKDKSSQSAGGRDENAVDPLRHWDGSPGHLGKVSKCKYIRYVRGTYLPKLHKVGSHPILPRSERASERRLPGRLSGCYISSSAAKGGERGGTRLIDSVLVLCPVPRACSPPSGHPSCMGWDGSIGMGWMGSHGKGSIHTRTGEASPEIPGRRLPFSVEPPAPVAAPMMALRPSHLRWQGLHTYLCT